jgi:hypothetical protein
MCSNYFTPKALLSEPKAVLLIGPIFVHLVNCIIKPTPMFFLFYLRFYVRPSQVSQTSFFVEAPASAWYSLGWSQLEKYGRTLSQAMLNLKAKWAIIFVNVLD